MAPVERRKRFGIGGYFATLCYAKEWGAPCLVGEEKPGDWAGHPPSAQTMGHPLSLMGKKNREIGRATRQ
jgi:hypothetical protein